MTIKHHPDDATLMEFAAGGLPEALAAVVSAHLMVCPRCRKGIATLDAMGASLFARLEPAAVSRAAPVIEMRAREADAASPPGRRRHPLDDILANGLDTIPWRRVGYGVWQHKLPLSQAGRGDLRLLKISPGRAMPEHGHGGSELTLVLDGAYSDEIGHFGAGDIADLGDEIEHKPVADAAAGCICLVATEHKTRFKGLLPRLLQPFIGI